MHGAGESADQIMADAHSKLATSAVTWESARLDLDPAEAVAEAKARWKTDCLFMGAFGRGRLRDLLFGSQTAEILDRSDGTVFVVPSGSVSRS